MSPIDRKAARDHLCTKCNNMIHKGELYQLDGQKKICWRHLSAPIYRRQIPLEEQEQWNSYERTRMKIRQKINRKNKKENLYILIIAGIILVCVHVFVIIWTLNDVQYNYLTSDLVVMLIIVIVVCSGAVGYQQYRLEKE